MREVEFPRRYAVGGTLARLTTTNRFFLNNNDSKSFFPKDPVKVSASNQGAFTLYRADDPDAPSIPATGNQGTQVSLDELYLQQTDDMPQTEFTLSVDEEGKIPVWRVPAHFHISRPAAIVLDYPSYPTLMNNAAQRLESVYNPLHIQPYDIGEPVYYGSVRMDVVEKNDIQIVQQFIDQLSDPDVFFELPLPDSHLGSASIDAYNTADGTITIPGSPQRQQYNLTGWFARVGRRTCRIISDDTVPVHESHIDFALPAGGLGDNYEVEVPDNTYDLMADGGKLTFLSVDGIDHITPANNGPEVGVTYYIKKLSQAQHRIEMYKNPNLTGQRILFEQSVDPIDYTLNEFVLGEGPYDSHLIKIVPAGLINGTTAADSANNFSSRTTMRVRATSVTAGGEAVYGNQPWQLEWVETNG